MQEYKPAVELAPDVRIVVEVDGNPVGFLNLDIERLWPLISHRHRDKPPIEWIDSKHYHEMLRLAGVKALLRRLGPRLYQALGDEIVRTELDLETFALKSETAAGVFGRTRQDIERFAAQSGRTANDFYAFFWDYLLDESGAADAGTLKKSWEKKRQAAS